MGILRVLSLELSREGVKGKVKTGNITERKVRRGSGALFASAFGTVVKVHDGNYIISGG